MKRILLLTLAVCLFATAAFADLEGAWTASSEDKRPDRMYINITRGMHHNMGNDDAPQRLRRTSPRADRRRDDDARAVRDAPRSRQHRVRRHVPQRQGRRTVHLHANRGYIDAVRALGVPFDLEHRKSPPATVEEEELFALALHDVSTAFIKSMQADRLQGIAREIPGDAHLRHHAGVHPRDALARLQEHRRRRAGGLEDPQSHARLRPDRCAPPAGTSRSMICSPAAFTAPRRSSRPR
jgi:hypothetical protein